MGVTVDRGRHEAQRAVGQFMTYANICWCGVPEAFLRLLLVELDRYEGNGPTPQTSRARDAAGLALSVMLDCWELTEHGTSSAWAWLTPAGKRLRSALHYLDLGGPHRRSPDFEELHSEGGVWWEREHVLNPRTTSDGVPYAEFGEWLPDS